jgi:hypothetical protein
LATIRHAPVENGPVIVYEPPVSGTKYSIGIDTSTGLATDFSVMQVLSCRVPFEQVAVFRAKWSVIDVAEYANMLGRYYNDAYIVCETNYPGNAVQDALVMTYRYPRLYQAEQHLDESPNVSTKFGFQTTQASKWLLIREFLEALKDEDIIFNDPTTLDEFGSYVYIEDKTKTGAAQGLNDDCVMAMMLAFHGALMRPQKALVHKAKPSCQNIQHRAMMDRFVESLTQPEERNIIRV